MAKKRYTRVEEEIIQILDKADREPAWKRLKRRGPQRPQRPRPPSRFRIAGPWLWLGSAFGFALLAILLSDWSQLVAGLLVIAAIVAFLSPVVLSRRQSRPQSTGIQRWRGQDIELIPERSTTFERLRYRWRRWRRRW